MQHYRPHLLKRHPPVIGVRRMQRDQFHKPLCLSLASLSPKKLVRLVHQNRMPHLRDGFIVAKVGYFRGSENPDTLNSPIPP